MRVPKLDKYETEQHVLSNLRSVCAFGYPHLLNPKIQQAVVNYNLAYDAYNKATVIASKLVSKLK